MHHLAALKSTSLVASSSPLRLPSSFKSKGKDSQVSNSFPWSSSARATEGRSPFSSASSSSTSDDETLFDDDDLDTPFFDEDLHNAELEGSPLAYPDGFYKASPLLFNSYRPYSLDTTTHAQPTENSLYFPRSSKQGFSSPYSQRYHQEVDTVPARDRRAMHLATLAQREEFYALQRLQQQSSSRSSSLSLSEVPSLDFDDEDQTGSEAIKEGITHTATLPLVTRRVNLPPSSAENLTRGVSAKEVEARWQRTLAFAQWSRRGRAQIWEAPEGASEGLVQLVTSLEG